MFSSKSLILSGLRFRSLIHFEFIFVYGVRECSTFKLMTWQTPLYLLSKEGPHLRTSQSCLGLWGIFLVNCYVISVIIKGKTENKINGKPCQILVNTGACRWNPGKTDKSGLRKRILPRVSSPWISACGSNWERKIKYHVIPSFPKPDTVVIDPFSPNDNCHLLFCHYLSLSFFWPSLGVALRSWEGSIFCTFFGNAS